MLSSNRKLEDQALSFLKRAEDVEQKGRKNDAYDMYTRGLELLLKAIKKAKTDSRKDALRKKCNVYMSHAEMLKQSIDSEQPPKKRITVKKPALRHEPKPIRYDPKPVKYEPKPIRNHPQPKKRHMKRKTNSKSKQSKRLKGKVDAIYDRIENEILDSSPSVQFKDVFGMQNVKQVLHESIVLPNLRPDIFTGLRAPPKGLLLFGPPGNGKTMIAKAVATECHACFFNMSASSLTSKFVGEGEKLVRALFEVAAERAPSIVFIDEIDSLLTSRGGNNEMESSRRMKTEFLVQFDGVGSSSERILVIGATNLPSELDDAVIRRFTKRILVPLPDPDTRQQLLTGLLGDTPNQLNNADMRKIVNATNTFSGSDLKALTSDAAMGPIREVDDITKIDSNKIPPVKINHFLESLQTIRPSSSESSLLMYRDWNEKYGSKIKLKMKKNDSSFSFSNLFR